MSYVPDHKTKIMIHCLATPPSWGRGKHAEQMLVEVRDWHVKGRGWSAEAYAEIIDYEGIRAKGRDLNDDGNTFDDTGAGASGHNYDTIHIALAGGKWEDGRWGEATDKFSDHFTPAQDKALRKVIAEINSLAGRELKVIGHNEVNQSKGCPSFNVQEWLMSEKDVGFSATLQHPDPAEQKPTGFAALLTALIALVQGFLSRR